MFNINQLVIYCEGSKNEELGIIREIVENGASNKNNVKVRFFSRKTGILLPRVSIFTCNGVEYLNEENGVTLKAKRG